LKPRVVLSWSGGKDCLLALERLSRSGDAEVVALLTTVTEGEERVAAHGVRRALLGRQAEALGLPLTAVSIPPHAGNASYEAAFREVMEPFRTAGVHAVAFGDIFLADVRDYRERLSEAAGLRSLFPLWDEDTARLAREVLALGYRALTVCVDTRALPCEFAGRAYDEAFLAALPETADPCGENGEFHTFVHAGPRFRQAVRVTRGETVLRDARFCFCDLLPA
jgi:uncharacterized protein (TIGR00290 family)